MNEELAPKRQSQITNEFQLLEKTVEELGVVNKALSQRLEAVTREQKESSKKPKIPEIPFCPMAQKIRSIKDKIKDEIDYLENLKSRIEV